jgi:hypothetical protein
MKGKGTLHGLTTEKGIDYQMPPRPLTKTAERRIRVEERKLAREKQKQSAFLRKTLNIYNAMARRRKENPCAPCDEGLLETGLPFSLEHFRNVVRVDMGYGGCAYCTVPLTVTNFAVDHYEPIARGGGFGLGNVRICCKSCNWQKGALTGREFRILLTTVDGLGEYAATDINYALASQQGPAQAAEVHG